MDECKPLDRGGGRGGRAGRLGRGSQVDPIKPTLKASGAKPLKLESDILLSSFPFKFNLRHYKMRAELNTLRRREEAAEVTAIDARAHFAVGPDQALTLVPISAQLQLTLPLSAQLKLTVFRSDMCCVPCYKAFERRADIAETSAAGAYTRPLSAQRKRIVWDRGAFV